MVFGFIQVSRIDGVRAHLVSRVDGVWAHLSITYRCVRTHSHITQEARFRPDAKTAASTFRQADVLHKMAVC